MDVQDAIGRARLLVDSYKIHIGAIGRPVTVLPAQMMNSIAPTPIAEGSILYEITRIKGIKLIWHPVLGNQTSIIKAAYLNFGDEAWAIVPEHNKRCWTRFYLCKEFIHAMLSEDDNKTLHSDEIRDLIKNLLLDIPEELNNPILVEHAAKFAAIELLLPRELWGEVKEMVELKCTPYQIAQSFLVPEDVVLTRIHPAVIKLFDQTYEALGI